MIPVDALDKLVVVVTGASGGLGREMTLWFSREGARVVLVSHSVEKLKAVADAATGETLSARGPTSPTMATLRRRLSASAESTRY